MRRVAPETGGLLEFDSVQAKLCADIARHLGRRRNANECFGVCSRRPYDWHFTGRDMVWYINWLTIRGGEPARPSCLLLQHGRKTEGGAPAGRGASQHLVAPLPEAFRLCQAAFLPDDGFRQRRAHRGPVRQQPGAVPGGPPACMKIRRSSIICPSPCFRNAG